MFDKDAYWRNRRGVVLAKNKRGKDVEVKVGRPMRGQGLFTRQNFMPDAYIPQGPEFSKGISKKARRRAREVLHG